MKKIQFIFIAAILSLLVISVALYEKEKRERQRLKANQSSLMGEVERWRTKDSLNVLSNTRLILTVRELDNYNSKLTKKIESQGIKIKRLESISHTGTQTITKIVTQIKDSLVYVDNVIVDTFRCIDYISPYLDLKGCFGQENVFHGNIVSRDTLIQTVHRVPKKFLCIKWGTKGIRQNIMSTNPFTQIMFSDYIELK